MTEKTSLTEMVIFLSAVFVIACGARPAINFVYDVLPNPVAFVLIMWPLLAGLYFNEEIWSWVINLKVTNKEVKE